MKRVMVTALAAMMLLVTTVVAQDETSEPTVAATPDATATAGPEAKAPRIDWASSGIELAADDLRLRVGDRVVTAPGEVLPLGNTYVDEGQLEAWWYEDGTQHRLNINLELDETDWWVDSIWAYDGRRDSGWIYFKGLEERTRTPLGEPLVGDVRLRSTGADRKAYRPKGSAVLRLDGLALRAFTPGTRPAPLSGCGYVVDDGVEVTWEEYGGDEGGSWSTGYTDGVLQGPGEPLEGWKQMTPKQAEAALQAAGLCYRVDHSWTPAPRFEDRRLDRELEIYFDRRCSAPETGKLTGVSFGPDYPSGEPDVIVYLTVRESGVRDWPEPPPYGTDCPSQ